VDWTQVLALVIAVAAVQLAMLRPPFPSDSMAFFWWADSIGGNEISHGTTRLGVLVPVRLGIEAFGTSEAAYYVASFSMFLLLVASTYVVGIKIIGSRLVGTASALAMALSTLVLGISSQLLPDTFAAS
jgi:hypothetical protein